MAIGTQLVLDKFAGNNRNPLGFPWSNISGYGNCQVFSNRSKPSLNTFAGIMYNYITPGLPWPVADQYGEITVAAASLGVVGVGVRMDFTQKGYFAILQDGQSTNGIYRLDFPFTFTSLLTGVTSVPPGDVWRIVVSGSLITCFQNGAKRYQTTDATYAAPGFGAGLYQSVGTDGSLPPSDSQIALWFGGSAILTAPSIVVAQGKATITGHDDGVTLTYTTDGTAPIPGSNGTVYTDPFHAEPHENIQAVASLDGYTTSPVGTINDPGSGGAYSALRKWWPQRKR